VACGGNDRGEPLLDEFLQQQEALSVEAAERYQALGDELLTEESASEEQEIKARQEFFSGMVRIHGDLVAGLEDIHDRLADVESVTELERASVDLEWILAGDRLQGARIEISKTADDIGIEVDLMR
jgi:hypothetical protein